MIAAAEFVTGKRPFLRNHPFLCLLLFAGLLLPAAASAQVTYTGAAATQNFGSQAIGSTSAAQTFSFSVAAGTTIGSIAVVTQGAPNLDFTSATGGTCTATTYPSTTTCTVNVTFKPKFAGERYGAVVFFSEASNTGTVLGSVLIYGTGAGPEVVFSPATLSTLGGGFSNPYGVAVDGSGNVYVANASVNEMPPGCASSSCVTTLGGGFGFAQDVAVDGSGNVYVADWGGSAVYEMPPGCASSSCVTELGGGIVTPTALAVDRSGNVYAAEWEGGAVKEIPPGCASSSCVTTLGGGFSVPSGVAVDGSGNVFVTDESTISLVKVMPPGCASSSCVTTLGGGWDGPSGIAVDGSGNVYVTDYSNGTLKEMPPGCASSSCVTTLGVGFNNPGGGSVAVDGSGNVYVASYCISCNGAVYEMDRATPPTLSFPTPTEVGTTDTTDGTQTVQVVNIGNEALTLTALSYPADFSPASGDVIACTGTTSLSAGQECDVPVEFTPEHTGALSEDLTLTDNALNVSGAQQMIGAGGTGFSTTAASHFTITTTASVVAGTPFSITVTAINSLSQTATTYNGTVSFSSSDPDFVNPGPLTLSSGVGQATVTLETAGTQTIAATDTTTSSLTGSGSFSVAAVPPPVTFTGAAANENFGSQAIGSTSAAKIFSFSVAAGTTVGSIGVVTQGAANLDFNSASGGTCTAKEYASATTCTADVTFKPRGAGLRTGAVVFYSEANNKGTALGSVPVYGIGTGPQIAYNPAPATAVDPTVNGETLNSPAHVALDGAGDLFIADAGNNRVVEVPVGGGAATAISPTVNGEGLNEPDGMAVDGAGNLFISDFLNDRVVEVPAGGGAATAFDPEANGQGLSGPSDLALDGAGDLFIADFNNNRVVEVPAGGGAPTAIDPTVNGEGLSGAPGVAVDGAGNLFISDYNHNRVLEVPAAGGAPTAIAPTVNGEVLNQPNGVAVDGAGDVFMTDQNNNRVVEVPAGGGTPTAFDPIVNGEALNHPYAVALDGAGDLFIDDSINNREVELQRSQAPALNFPTVTLLGTTDTTDGAQTVQIQNIGNEALTLTALRYPADFSEASGDANACTGTASLSAGQECDLPVEFTPLHGGALSEDVMLTDNALNAASPGYAQQSISLTGTSIQLNSIVITPSSSFATLPGGSQQFTATGSYSGGSTQNLTSLVSWRSNNTTAVTIGASGLATAQAAGAATITASLNGVTSNAVTLTVESAAQASIAVSSGSGQSAYESAAFANPLVAMVKDTSGNAVQGVSVTFTAPSSGGGASFSNGAGAITVATDGNGLATEPVVANATAGNYIVTATAAGISGSVSFSLTNLAGSVYPVYSVTTLVDDPVGLGTNCTDPTLKVTSCSLRDAITAANALPQTTITPVTTALMPTINFASSLNLSAQSPGNYNVTNGGTLTIGANMNIVGPGANLVTLNGAGNQIINIGSGTVFLSGVSLVDGGTPTSEDPYGNGSSGSGGGIYNNGTLTVTNIIFSGNSATGGNGDGSGPPEIGTSGGNGSGGGIYNSGTLTVTNSTFSGNSANGGGGYGDAPGGGGSGGGIYNGGTLTVTNSTFSGNSTTGGTGGGGSDGDNDIGFPGSGGSGGGIYNGGTLTVTNSTFSGNGATGGVGGFGYNGQGDGGDGSGGGISNGGTLTVANSTFSGNGATGGGYTVGGNGYGGGISNGGTLTARNSTLSGNSANGGGGFVNGAGYGGGIYNSLRANADSNVYYNNLANGSEDDCNGCTTNTNAVSGDPKLTALGNYGGATQTMLPQPGSAAICAGAVGDIPVGVTTDQRGFARTNSTYEGGTVCVDAGAVQTNYAMAFTTEPPAIVLRGQAISPAPVVALTESGAVATAATSSVAMTDIDTLLSGTTTASFSSGAATFSNLLITSVTSSDKLIATLALNPTINLTAPSTAFGAQTTAPAELTSPAPGSVLDGPTVTFTWTAGTGTTAYGLWLGLNGVGSSDLYTLGSTTATSATVTGLQTRGAMIYARLFYEVAGVWKYLDYTYTEATSISATMISPSPGGTLGFSGVTFTWTAGTWVTKYGLWLGVGGPGSSDLYNSGLTTVTSITLPSLQAKGLKLYARLVSEGSGGTQYIDYTYTESSGTSAVLTSPMPGTTLGTSNVMFTWSGGADVTKYDLLVGVSAPGSTDLFETGSTTALTATVPKLPANGAKIYVRLMSDISGTWQYTDYTYTAQ